MRALWTIVAAVAASLALSAAAPPPDSNGVMGLITGEAGDPQVGAEVYAKRCGSCQDNATGRTPSKAAIGGNSRAFIAQTLFEGIMKPMAVGLKPAEVAGVAAYLSTRSGARPLAEEAPLCASKPS